MQMPAPVTSLPEISRLAEAMETENEAFRDFLRNRDTNAIDRQVQVLQEAITPTISCTDCGNCCRSLMIHITEAEISSSAAHIGCSAREFRRKYVEESAGGQLILNRIPCHFLDGNRCSIYALRFSECREFPHLHQPGINQRLFTLFMHYANCPIIFNVMEALKTSTGFRPAA